MRLSSVVLAVAVGLWACSKGGDGKGEKAADDKSNEAAGEPETAPIEQISGSIKWPAATATAESMKAARDAVSKGMATREALEAAGKHAGAPKLVGSGVANWLTRDDAGGCVNLMITAPEGEVKRVSFETFPKGSMGEAKCQNAGI